MNARPSLVQRSPCRLCCMCFSQNYGPTPVLHVSRELDSYRGVITLTNLQFESMVCSIGGHNY